MNGGHSVAAMLIANPTLEAVIFDLMAYKYSSACWKHLVSTFGQRLELHRGLSQRTIPAYTKHVYAVGNGADRGGRACDLMLVDGDHEDVGALDDLRRLRGLSTTATRIVIDDIQLGLALAVQHEQHGGRLVVLERYGPFAPASLHNPCMRTPAGWATRAGIPLMKVGDLCQSWGFVVARYANLSSSPRDWASPKEVGCTWYHSRWVWC